MIRRLEVLGAALVLASTVLAGCSQATDGDGNVAGTSEEEIVNGAPATDARYAAVGALAFVLPGVGVGDVFCSGTLVGPRAVVTARHCMPQIDLARESGLVPAFVVGADGLNPTQIIPITSYVAAPAGPGGLLPGGGRDVAVVRLGSAPTGVKPAALGLWENKMINQRFQIAGYGVRNAEGYYGSKFAGVATARAIKGRWYELLFKGNYGAYRQWYFTDSPNAARTEAEARSWWDTYKLETDYELLAGGLRGEAVGCNVDSGGPLMTGTTANNATVYGVSFAVEQTISSGCGLGGAYLVFNRKMFDFVKSAL